MLVGHHIVQVMAGILLLWLTLGPAAVPLPICRISMAADTAGLWCEQCGSSLLYTHHVPSENIWPRLRGHTTLFSERPRIPFGLSEVLGLN